ncbi:hypothetical protein HPB49_021480 [Dermacentor silvarum]|uniref:Uncharacterized protein n=1 Tax=Dermacentor silvarum TaxID=543639 RepID=A0ACB8C5F4_DERSI|nr:hypothetical protein HPB49_021480 [Dermacentor silvarum]
MDEKNDCTASAFWVTEDLSGGGGAEAEGPKGQGNTAPGEPSSDVTHPDYVPTVFTYRAQQNTKQKMSRYRCGKKRASRQLDEPEQSDSKEPSVACECDENDTGTCTFETQTELAMKDVSSCMAENAALRGRLVSLEQQLAAARKKNLKMTSAMGTNNSAVVFYSAPRLVMFGQRLACFHSGRKDAVAALTRLE